MTGTVDLREILHDFHDEHPAILDGGGEDLAQGIARALDLVPSSGVDWAIVHRHPVLLVRSPSTLFQLRIDPEERSITLSSRPLSGERLIVALDWSDPERGEGGAAVRETRWNFRYEGIVGEEEWQRMAGKVSVNGGEETLDRRERFARNLARDAGWEPPGHTG